MERRPEDFSRVLSSMCTRPHPAARAAAETFLATNPGDPGTFPSVAALEDEAVSMLGEIVGLPEPTGYIGTGGTEANLQAVRVAKCLAETDTPNIVVPTSAHFSFDKAASILDVELRRVGVTDDRTIDLTALESQLDEDTALVVAVTGTTEYGRVDPIPEVANIAKEIGARCHVDAAWGGFHLPFTDHRWQFDHAPIDSMTIDPHKVGQAAIPAGGFLVRDEATLDALTVETPYLVTDRQPTLVGTRSGAGVASTLAALEALWPDGYRSEYERAMALATWLDDEFDSRGIDAIEPVLPLVSAPMDRSTFEALRDEGWRISRTRAGEVRIVVMPHVTRPQLEAFLDDLDAVMTQQSTDVVAED